MHQQLHQSGVPNLRLGMWHVLSNAVPSCCLTSSQASTAVAQPLCQRMASGNVVISGHQRLSAAIRAISEVEPPYEASSHRVYIKPKLRGALES